jgi:hypothetical protein
MQTRKHYSNRNKEPQWRRKKEPQWKRRGSQKHHCNWHLKNEKMQKTWIKNVVGQTIVIIELWHQEECKSPSYVHDHTYKLGLLKKL